MDIYIQIFITTLAFAFGLFHFILFLNNREQKANLVFALFLIFYAASTFIDYQSSLTTVDSLHYTYLRIHRLLFPFAPIFALLFFYVLFQLKIPIQFWIICFGIILSSIPAVINPLEYFIYPQFFLIAILFESFRVYYVIISAKKRGSKLVSFAFSMLLLFSIYDVLLDFNLMKPIYNIHNGYPFGFLILVFLMTVFLANNYARSNRELLEKEREAKELELSQKLLEAENKRKQKELNDARDLQLSLLPHCETNINNYSFCFSMRPATEVGGDYYDYRISEDNVISLVVGDATDHGLKAGMMVSIVKSLFLTLAEETPIIEFLNRSSQTIKQMKLKNLFMALMMLRIEGNKVTFSSAGIPPLLVYRKESNTIEEYKIKGMPLGAVESFPYETISLSLEKEDIVLLMTDGLPELFNSNKISFGYEKLKEEFLNNAHKNPAEIVDSLLATGDEWKGDSAQNDDITLVAFQLNSK